MSKVTVFMAALCSVGLFSSGLLAEEVIDTSGFAPLPKVVENAKSPLTPEKIALGRKLYFETRMSKGNDLSCNSCHGLKQFGVDNKAFSPGHEGQLGGRNSPTVYNAALHIAQFWDGRAKDVEEQALGPILNPVEMAMPAADDVIERLAADPDYAKMFQAAFPKDKDPVTFDNIGKAIGAFERTLVTPSRFDDFLNGKKDALTKDELRGFKTFKEVGCTICHAGVGLGGMMYQKLGLVKPYPTKDTGRFEVTKNEADKFFFKVPSLRNVEKTAPYFHDGSVKTLEESVSLMGEYQLGRKLTDAQVKDIVTFLKTLTGTHPEMTK